MTLYLSDREKQVVLAALEFFRRAKQGSILPAPEQLPMPFASATSEYDLLSPQHTLMHTLKLLSTITQKPIEHFANPNPSQDPPTSTHPAPLPDIKS